MPSDQADRKPWVRRFRFLRFLFGVRGLLSLVLLFGGLLGWWDHSARVQREAVETVKRLGGGCLYDWEFRHGQGKPGTLPGWRRWLVATLGPDYVGSITQVHLGFPPSGKLTVDDLAKIGRLPRLEHLMVLNAPSVRQGLDQLRNLSRLKHLDYFQMGGIAEADMSPLANLAEIEELQLSLPSMRDADLAHVANLTRLEQLRLVSANSSFTDAGLVALERLHDLQLLQLSGPNITNAGLSHIAGLTRLEILEITGTKVTSLESLRPLVALKILCLDRTAIDDAGVAPVAGYLQLASFSIHGDKAFTDAGLVHLRALPRLAHLDIRGTGVDDTGAASLAGFPRLKEILLSFTSLTDAGLAALAKRPGPALIDVGYTKVSPEGVAAARSALPGTTISD